MKLSIAVVSYKDADLLADCLDSLRLWAPDCTWEVIVVNNDPGQTQDLLALSRRNPFATWIMNDRNLGFARANNQAFAVSRGEYFLLLNSDCRLINSTLNDLVRFMDDHRHVGAAGCQLVYHDGRPRFSHAPLPTLLRELLVITGFNRVLAPHRQGLYRCLGWMMPRAIKDNLAGPSTGNEVVIPGFVSGACLMIRRVALQEIGGLDEGYFMYYEDVDLCRSLSERGWAVVSVPWVTVEHDKGARDQGLSPETLVHQYRSRFRYFRKFHGLTATTVLRTVTAAVAVYRALLRLSVGRSPDKTFG